MLDTKKLKAYARKFKAMKKCDAMAKKLRKELEAEARGYIDHMVTEEVDRLSLKGGDVLSIKREIWPKMLAKDENDKTDKIRIVKALRQAGLHETVTQETYQPQRLAGYLRELAKSEQQLPECLQGIIEANEKLTLVVRTFK